MQINTDELPYEFAHGHRGLIDFHNGTGLGEGRRGRNRKPDPLSESSLSKVNGRWEITDREWVQIAAIITSKNPGSQFGQRHSPRAILDGIVEKMGSGVPWRKMRYKAGDSCNATAYYRKWQRGGQWEQILKVLQARNLG
ncbi:MAG: transposase [Thiobacillaceae bacterium]